MKPSLICFLLFFIISPFISLFGQVDTYKQHQNPFGQSYCSVLFYNCEQYLDYLKYGGLPIEGYDDLCIDDSGAIEDLSD